MYVEDFVQAVHDALQYWLDIHTDPQKWAAEWFADDPLSTMSESNWKLSNRYFEVDMRAACARVLFDQYNWYECPECGEISESSYCDNCKVESDDASELAVVDYLRQTGYQIDEYTIEVAMVKYAFPVYREALDPIIGTIIEEVTTALSNMDAASDNYEKLVAMLAALGIMHHSGNITDDHCEKFGFDADDVDTVRTGGLTALFDKDEVEEWLMS